MPAIRPDFTWLSEPRLQTIMAALEAGGEARLVGGCVRDALLGQSPLTSDAIDIDIATDRTPAEMKALFDAAGIRWIATGEEHGTLTAIEDGLVTECTSLRADVATDGRHAEVRFTRDWDEDWRRRDFTINALYADRQGRIFDPAGGQKDLAAGRVRFIGDAAERIREDALRILRFFRFSARFAASFDGEALDAIKAHTELLDILSRERVWSELKRTFAAARAPEAFGEAHRAGVMTHILPGEPRLDVFERLHARGHREVVLSLVALWPGTDAKTLKKALRVPNEVADLYAATEEARAALEKGMAAHELLYRFGAEPSQGAARLAEAEGGAPDPMLAAALSEEPPVLPISGKHIIARGVAPGPEVSQALKRFEEAWLKEGAPTDDASTERLLDEVLGR